MTELAKATPISHRMSRHLEEWQARVEASRCLGCYDAPCITGCPTWINIPQFIGRIQVGNLEGAYQTLIENNPLPAVCGLVCPTEYLCERRCVQTQLSGRPVEIAALQYYVSSHAQSEERWHTTRKEKIAVVGGGPGGIACAIGLRRKGFDVDLFDAREQLGGLLMFSIPNYRLPDQAVTDELARLERSGIKFRLGEPVNAAKLRELISNYDAVFLAIGLSTGKELETPGSELAGVHSALDYLEQMRRGGRGECDAPELKGRVIVVGGGNVAVDAACTAVRAGAKHVAVLYRRTREQMPAWESEYQEALELGVEFRWLTGVNEIIGEHGKVSGVLANKMRLLDNKDSSGRLRVEVIPGSEEPIACEAVIMAVGQALDFDGLPSLGIETTNDGLVKSNPATFQTSVKNVFAGGDAVNGGTYVVQAIAEGMQAADAIYRYLNGDGS